MGALALFLLGLFGVGMALNEDKNKPGSGGNGNGGQPISPFNVPGGFPPGSTVPGSFPSGLPQGFPGSLPGGAAPGNPPGGAPAQPMPNGDPPMPADLQAIVNQALTDPNGNPFALQMAANACDLAGFHKTAADLRTRANVLTPPPQQAPAPGAAPQPQQLSIPGLGPIAIPPGFTLPPGLLPQQPNQNPAVTPLAAPTYVIRSGDSASAIALKFTGDSTRWRELLTSNPTLKADTEDVNGTPTTLVKPFNPGQILILPPSWPALPKS